MRPSRSHRRSAAVAAAVVLVSATMTASASDRSARTCVMASCAHRPFSRPLISLEFDDGYADALLHGLPIVEEFGWTAQMNVITGQPDPPQEQDRSRYLSDEQIVAWSRRGDIASHSVTHPALTHVDDARLTRELVDSRARLESLLGRPVDVFVTPGCDHDARVAEAARRYYTAMRNCDPHPYVNDDHDFDRWNIRSYPVKRGIPPGWIQDQLDQTRRSNGWSVFVWHHVDDAPTGDAYTSTTAQLRRDLQLIRDSGITVVTSREALLEELGGRL